MTKATLTKFPGVHRRKDSGIYQFGLRAPIDLLPHFPGGWAVRCSLRTADLREANTKAKALQADWSRKFDEMRIGKSQPISVELPVLRRELLGRFERLLTVVDAQCSRVSGAARPEKIASLKEQIWDYREALKEGTVPEWAEEQLDKMGYARNPLVDAELLAHIVSMYEVRLEALTDVSRTFPVRVELLKRRRELLGSLTQNVLIQHLDTSSRRIVETGHTISDALNVWRQIQRSEKTARTFARHAQQFADMMGDPFLESIDKTMGIEFRDALQQWAIKNRKTANTADNVMVSIRALVNVARDKGWISGNPFERLAVKIGGKESEGREPWTHAELKILFDDPIWTQGRLPTERKAGGAAAYWIPLIACYTGARVSEIAQLWTSDLGVTPGQEVIEFRSDAERAQKLKTKGSWRAVPMHSELIRLGLPEYVTSLPEGHLFPLLPRNGQNGAGGQFSKWFGDFKSQKGFQTLSKSMHSFRHLVASELRLSGAQEAQADAIIGHAGSGIGRRVYSATIRREAERLRAVIELLKYPELNLKVVSSFGT